jgi:hypothetical protein
MKLKVIAYTFSVPLVWLTLLLLHTIFPDLGISRILSIGVLIGLFIGSLIGRLFLVSKYLTELLVNNEVVSLTYLTPLGRQRQLAISLDEVKEMKMEKKSFLVRDFPSLIILSIDNKSKFYLLNNDVKQAAIQLLQAFHTHPIEDGGT